jgi:hypothetical protein
VFPSKIYFGVLGVQNLFWGVGSPKFILGCWESKIYFGVLGVQNLFWGVGSPKFILGCWESKIYFGVLGVQNLFWIAPTHVLFFSFPRAGVGTHFRRANVAGRKPITKTGRWRVHNRFPRRRVGTRKIVALPTLHYYIITLLVTFVILLTKLAYLGAHFLTVYLG